MRDSWKLRLLYVYCIAWKMLQALQQFSLGYRHCIVQTAMIGFYSLSTRSGAKFVRRRSKSSIQRFEMTTPPQPAQSAQSSSSSSNSTACFHAKPSTSPAPVLLGMNFLITFSTYFFGTPSSTASLIPIFIR
jgi:hypothetical protein